MDNIAYIHYLYIMWVKSLSTKSVKKTKATEIKERMAKNGIVKQDHRKPELSIEAQQNQLAVILEQLEERKKKFSICDTKLDKIPQQKQLLEQMIEESEKSADDRLRFTLYYGWNGAGKSACGAYITVLKALWRSTKKYGLPYIGSKKVLWIVTKSGSNVKSTIMPYLLGEGSITRIPPEEILGNPKMDNGILKSIELKNWAKIIINTYDQGAEALQGSNPDWIWLDEEPRDESVVAEIFVRTRVKECEMLVTMTPLSGLTPIYEWFINQQSEKVRSKSRVYLVSSLDNPFTDHTWAEGLTEEQYRLRVLGSFENPTGLVYSSFHRRINVVPHFDPEDMGDDLRYYRAIDFGTSHPTAMVFAVQDTDDNIYIYDEIYRANTLLKDIVKEINEKSKWVSFLSTIRDTAAKREGTELAELGIRTTPADKHSRGENDMSNRRTGIMLVNQLFHDKKLFISDKCKNLIRELESHYYKEGGNKDGEVIKLNDDALDAMRYMIFSLRKNNTKTTSYMEAKSKEAIRQDNGIRNGSGKFCNF